MKITELVIPVRVASTGKIQAALLAAALSQHRMYAQRAKIMSISTRHQTNVNSVLEQETQVITLFVTLVHLENILVQTKNAKIVLQRTEFLVKTDYLVNFALALSQVQRAQTVQLAKIIARRKKNVLSVQV